MSVTFIIGNGFDKNCGLASDYKDVYKEYCIHKDGESEIIRKFKDDIENDIALWSDFEEKMSKYASKLENEEQFIECVDDFSRFLNEYLSNQEEIFENRISAVKDKRFLYKELKESIDDFYKGLTNNIDIEVSNGIINSGDTTNIISFNYTNTLEIIRREAEFYSLDTIIHIHGTLIDNDVVLGMDNINQFNNLKYDFTSKGQRHFIKPFFNEQFDSIRVKNAKNYIKQSSYICIFGASLGDSDLTWKNLIKGWILESPSRQLFIYDYHYSLINETIPQRKLDLEDEARDLYIEKLGLSEEKEFVINRINIMIGKNIFNFNDVINEGTFI